LKKGDETMKIDDKIISYEVTGNMRNLSPGGTDRVEREKPTAGEKVSEQAPPEGDAIVRLSEASKEAQRIKEIVLSQPEIREDKVASTREKIESGDYAVDYEGVADKLVNAFIEDLI
jgi:flagellar biosynthesis anti-sigma factor FlgM